jgi:hypothetical protein
MDGYYIVQFDGPILTGWKTALLAAGAQLFDYIPDFGFVVKMDTEARAAIEALPHVRWVGLYQPGFRLAPSLFDGVLPAKAMPGQLIVVVFSGEDLNAIVTQLEALGGEVLDLSQTSWKSKIKLAINPTHALQIATIDGVRWVEPAPVFKLTNSEAADIMDVREVWNTHGLYGEGQIVGVCDTGLDQGSPSPGSLHDDFENGSGASRVIALYDLVGDGAEDRNSGHGTHVAGSVLGNGDLSDADPASHTFPATCYAGMAPDAQLVFQAAENDAGALVGIPFDLNTLFYQAYDVPGARIHSNSWSSAVPYGAYSSSSEDVDEFVWDYPDFLPLFAASNDGIDEDADGVIDLNSMGIPATAKNCIAVGATENNRPSDSTPAPGYDFAWGTGWPTTYPADPVNSDHVSDNPTGMAAFSSRGPTLDGRRKPDLVAPGTNIASARSSWATSTGWGAINANYMFMGGTSMATPLTAGAAALVREFYTDQGVSPSAALLKATLINGATDLYPGQYGAGAAQEQSTARPNNVQGWGRVNVENSLFPTSPRAMDYFDFAEGIETNEYDTFTFDLTDTSEELRATLAWSDHPGTTAAAGRLVNDLDLHVTDPGSTVHYPTNAAQRGASQHLYYDDWGAESGRRTSQNWRLAARFTPTSHPVTVDKGLFFVGSNFSFYPKTFNYYVYDDSGTGGAPGTALASGSTTIRRGDWHVVDLSGHGIIISSGDFYLAIEVNDSDLVWMIDTTATDNRAWILYYGTWYNYNSGLGVSEDVMFHAIVRGTDPATNYDRVNNVVGVDLGVPSSTGDYVARVDGYNVASGPQPYALVTSGAVALSGASSYRIFGAGDVDQRTLGRTGVELDFASGPGGNVTVAMDKAAPDNPPPSGVTFADIDWNISSAMTGFDTQVVFTYDETDLGALTEGSISGMFRWNSGTYSWDHQGGTVDVGANTVTIDGVTAFSDWALGGPSPTGVELARLEAWPDGPAIHVEWETATEIDLLGFNVHRSDAPEGQYLQLNEELIASQSPGSPVGEVYTWTDNLALPQITYYYKLEGLNTTSSPTFHGPVSATVESYFLYLPLTTKP